MNGVTGQHRSTWTRDMSLLKKFLRSSSRWRSSSGIRGAPRAGER